MGEAEAEPWHSPDVWFQPLQAGTITAHGNTVEIDGWPPPQLHATEASTLVYYKRTQTRQNTYCDSNPLIAFLVSFQTAGSVCLSVCLTRYFQDFLFICVISLVKMPFSISSNKTRVWQRNKRRRERARRAEDKEPFLQDQPAYKSNPITSLWLCSIVGLNGIRRRRNSSREHIVGW